MREKQANGLGRNVKVSAADAIDSLPEDHQTCIYRVVQEAVNSAAEVEIRAPSESGNAETGPESGYCGAR